MLEIVQHASFRIDSFELLSKCNKHGRAEQFKIIWNREGQEVIITWGVPSNSSYIIASEHYNCNHTDRNVHNLVLFKFDSRKRVLYHQCQKPLLHIVNVPAPYLCLKVVPGDYVSHNPKGSWHNTLVCVPVKSNSS